MAIGASAGGTARDDKRVLAAWEVDGLDVRLFAPETPAPFTLQLEIRRPSSGERELRVWDATLPDVLLATADARAPRLREGGPLRVICEQGIGDVVQQLRYLSPLAAAAGALVIECRPELHRLIVREFQGVVCVGSGEAAGDAQRVSLMELNRWFPDSTGGAAYLRLPEGLPPRCDPPSGLKGLRVGLNWSTNVRAAGAEPRSLAVSLLRNLVTSYPDIDWVSLQWGAQESELDGHRWARAIERRGGSLRDVADLAEAIAGLDLLISIDSAPAHVAGALGVPVWVAMSRPCSWRWGLDRRWTPLYRSMTLFRQDTPGDWQPVVAALAGALANGGPGTAPAEAETPSFRGAAPRDTLAPSVDAVFRKCCEAPHLRSRFVDDPLGVLDAHDVTVRPDDHRMLARVYETMVACHGGFSWCLPAR